MAAPDVLFRIGGDLTDFEAAMAKARQLSGTVFDAGPLKAAAAQINQVFTQINGSVQQFGTRLDAIGRSISQIAANSGNLSGAVLKNQKDIETMLDRIVQSSVKLGALPNEAITQINRLEQAYAGLDATSAKTRLPTAQMTELALTTDRTTRSLRDMATAQTESAKVAGQEAAAWAARNKDMLAGEQAVSNLAVSTMNTRKRAADEAAKVADQEAAAWTARNKEMAKSAAASSAASVAAAEQERKALSGLTADLQTLTGLRTATPAVKTQIDQTTAALANLQGSLGPLRAIPADLDAMRRATAAAADESAALTKVTLAQNAALKESAAASRIAGVDIAGMATRVALVSTLFMGFGVVLGGIGKTIGVLIEVDAQLAKIAGTISDLSQRGAILSQSSAMIYDAMKQTGKNAAEAGSLILELQKATNGSAETLRATYLPALALTAQGETNTQDTVRTLIGLYANFGHTLKGVTTEAEAYTRLSDMIIKASNSSVASVKSIVDALGFVGPTAKQSGIDFGLLLAMLTSMQDLLDRGSMAGTSLRQVLLDLTLHAPKAATAFDLLINAANPDPIKLLLDILALLNKEMKETGAISQETRDKLTDAFGGDVKKSAAIITLLDAFPKLTQKQEEFNAASGEGTRILEEQAKGFSVAAHAAGVEFVQALDAVSKAVTGDTPARVSAFTQLFINMQVAIQGVRAAIESIPKAPEGILPELGRWISGEGKMERGFEAASAAAAAGERWEIKPEIVVTPTTDTAANKRKVKAIIDNIAREGQAANVETPIAIRIGLLQTDLDKVRQDIAATTTQIERSGETKETKAALEKSLREEQQRINQISSLRKQAADAGTRAREKEDRELLKIGETTLKVLEADEKRVEAAEKLLATQRDQAAQLQEELDSTGEIATAMTKIERERTLAIAKLGAAGTEGTLTEDQISEGIERENRIRLAKIALFWKQVAIKESAALAEQVKIFTDASETELDAFMGRIRTFQIDAESALSGGFGLSAEGIDAVSKQTDAFISKTLLGIPQARKEVLLFNATFGETAEQAALNTIAINLLGITFDQLASMEDEAAKKLVPLIRQLALLRQESAAQKLKADVKAAADQLAVFTATVGQSGLGVDILNQALKSTGQQFGLLTAAQQLQVIQLAIYNKALAEAGARAGLAAAGLGKFADEILNANEAMAAQRAPMDAAANALEIYNRRLETTAASQARLDKETARFAGDTIGFFIASLQEASAKAGGFWDDFEKAAANTFAAAQRSMSDLFFNVLQGNFDSAKDAVASFGQAILRELSNVLASAVVRDFLALFTGKGFSGEGLIGSLLGFLSGAGRGGTGGTGAAGDEFGPFAPATSLTTGPTLSSIVSSVFSLALPLVLQAAGAFGIQGAGMIGSGLGLLPIVKELGTIAQQIGLMGSTVPAWAAQNNIALGEAVSGALERLGLGGIIGGLGSALGLIGSLTDNQTLSNIGTGITGLITAINVLSTIFPTLGASVATALAPVVGEAIATAVGSAFVGSTATGAVGTVLTGGTLGGAAAPAAMFIPFIAMAMGIFMDSLGSAQLRHYRAFIDRQREIQQQDLSTKALGRLGQVERGELSPNDAAFRQDLQWLITQFQASARMRGTGEIEAGKIAWEDSDAGRAARAAYVQDFEDRDRAMRETFGPLVDAIEALGIKALNPIPEHLLRFEPASATPFATSFGEAADRYVRVLARLGDTMKKGADAAEELTAEQAILLLTSTLTAQSYNEIAKAVGVATQEVPDLLKMLKGLAVDQPVHGAIPDVIPDLPDDVSSQQLPTSFVGDMDALGKEAIKAFLDSMRKNLIESIAADPIKALRLLDFGALQKEGEDIKATVQRMGVALQGLNDIMKNLGDEAKELREGTLPIPQQLKKVTDAITKEAADVQKVLMSTMDPEIMLASATRLRELIISEQKATIQAIETMAARVEDLATKISDASAEMAAKVTDYQNQINQVIERGARERAQLEKQIQEVEERRDKRLREIAEAQVRAVAGLADLAEILSELPFSLVGATSAMYAFMASLDNATDKLAALPALLTFARAEVAGNIPATGPRALEPNAVARERLGALAGAAGPAILETGRAIAGIGDPEKRLTAWLGFADQMQAFYKQTIADVHALFDAARTEARRLYDERIEAINTERAAAQEAYDLRAAARAEETESLNEQRDAINETVEKAKEWQRIAEDLGKLITQLKIGPLAPPNAAQQYAIALAAFERAKPEDVGAAGQDVLDTVLRTGLMTRPDPEYQALFERITGRMEDVRAQAEALGSPAEQGVAQLKIIDARLKEIAAEEKVDRKALEATLKEFAAQEKEAAAGLKAYLDSLDTQEKSLISDIETAFTPLFAGIAGEIASTIAAVNALGPGIIEAANKDMVVLWGLIQQSYYAQIQQIGFLQQMIQATYASAQAQVNVLLAQYYTAVLQLQELTAGRTAQDAIKKATEDAARKLDTLAADIHTSLETLIGNRIDALVRGNTPEGIKAALGGTLGDVVTAVTNGLGGDGAIRFGLERLISQMGAATGKNPSFATGSWFTQEGPAAMHTGEIVVPMSKPAAQWLREGGLADLIRPLRREHRADVMGGTMSAPVYGGDTHYTVQFTISGVTDPDRIAAIVEDKWERLVRGPRGVDTLRRASGRSRWVNA